MRALFIAALAIAALFPAALQANDIVPAHGNYKGVQLINDEPYEVLFHFNGTHVSSVRLVIGSHLIHLSNITQQSTLTFVAHNGTYEVDGHWLHTRSVHCDMIHLTKPKARIGSLQAHH